MGGPDGPGVQNAPMAQTAGLDSLHGFRSPGWHVQEQMTKVAWKHPGHLSANMPCRAPVRTIWACAFPHAARCAQFEVHARSCSSMSRHSMVHLQHGDVGARVRTHHLRRNLCVSMGG
eukprot:4770372-Alexandrium_andersonii.AAC.1